MLRFDGKHNDQRRTAAEAGFVQEPTPDGVTMGLTVRPFRKTLLTYAVQIHEPFEVDTLEGMHSAKAGDWLAIGPVGEMYPIANSVFEKSYELVEEE